MKNLTELKMCHKSGKRWQMQAERDSDALSLSELNSFCILYIFMWFFALRMLSRPQEQHTDETRKVEKLKFKRKFNSASSRGLAPGEGEGYCCG